jgi:hypothetical protein
MTKCMLRTFLSTILLCGMMHARTYTTKFPNAENPLSESGVWVNGGTDGLDWHDCRTTSAFAFGTQPATINYDDSTCLVNGTWGANQTVEITIHTVTAGAHASFEEVEVRLRSKITGHVNTGYEINCSVKPGNAYMQIVRWNGALGDFTYLNGSAVGCKDGDVLKATISGSKITAYKNGTAIMTATDTKFADGLPGMGFYIQSGTSSANNDFGASSFTATDGVVDAPTGLSAVVH